MVIKVIYVPHRAKIQEIVQFRTAVLFTSKAKINITVPQQKILIETFISYALLGLGNSLKLKMHQKYEKMTARSPYIQFGVFQGRCSPVFSGEMMPFFLLIGR